MILAEKLKCVLHYKKKICMLLLLCYGQPLQTSYAYTLEKLAPLPNLSIDKRYFTNQGVVSPEDIDLLKLLCELISSETKSIKVAAFCLSYRPITQALGIAATKHNVRVIIVLDPSSLTYASKFFSKELPIDHENVHLYIYKMERQGCMHHKYMIFENTLDNRSLIFEGTLNFSYSALKHNNETVKISENKKEYKAFETSFEELKNNSLHIKGIKNIENLKENFITTDPLSYCDPYYLNKNRMSI